MGIIYWTKLNSLMSPLEYICWNRVGLSFAELQVFIGISLYDVVNAEANHLREKNAYCAL